MIKHTGQYLCEVCKQFFKTKNDLVKHKQTHIKDQEQVKMVCITCDKTFYTEHSFKQHMLAKHKEKEHTSTSDYRPVGHPDRYQNKQENNRWFACTKCTKLCGGGSELEAHMAEHIDNSGRNEGFQRVHKEKICRYFKNGYCAKGSQCLFKHYSHEPKGVEICKRGLHCTFLQQNRCNFYHEGVGIQNPKVSQEYNGQRKECRFQERCWNYSTCTYYHKQLDFQFIKRSNSRPLSASNMDTWINY